MRVRTALLLGNLCLVFQGCAPLGHSARTSLFQPLVYPRCLNDLFDHRHYCKLAEAAWQDYVSKAAAGCSRDFACGFKEGFVDYLNLGGTGAPPPVPPRCYWNSKYESAEGHKAIQDWFAGFRTGAEVAKASGARELVVLPASTCLPSSLPQASPPSPSPPSPASGASLPISPRSEEMLPSPRRNPVLDGPAFEGPPATGPRPQPGETSGAADPSLPVLPAAETTLAPPTLQTAEQPGR